MKAPGVVQQVLDALEGYTTEVWYIGLLSQSKVQRLAGDSREEHSFGRTVLMEGTGCIHW